MKDKFTDRVRKIMALSNQQAIKYNNHCQATEHILLGLLEEGKGVGVTVLKEMGVDIKEMMETINCVIEPGPDTIFSNTDIKTLELTPTAKRVIEKAITCSKQYMKDYVGTEHILYGLITVEAGRASKHLKKFGVKRENYERKLYAVMNNLKLIEKKQCENCVCFNVCFIIKHLEEMKKMNIDVKYIYNNLVDYCVYYRKNNDETE